MKTTKALFGILTVMAALLAMVVPTNAESFIGPTSSTNRFIIGTNESILIDTVLFDHLKSNHSSCGLTVANITYPVDLFSLNPNNGGGEYTRIKVIPHAVAGPGELVLYDQGVIHFTRLTNSSMQMILWGVNTNTATVFVPAGKTMQFFARVDGGNWYGNVPVATLSSGTQSFDVCVYPGDLLEGPITVSFVNSKQYDPTSVRFPCAFVSYWFVENVFQNPNTVLSLGAGVPNVMVQKSGNLNNWQPVATFPATLGSNSFYRLQISR